LLFSGKKYNIIVSTQEPKKQLSLPPKAKPAMRKITTIMVLLALFGCSKMDQPDPQFAKANKNNLFLSELFIDGVLASKNFYENNRPTKTVWYNENGPSSETFYEYDPVSRSVVFRQGDFVHTDYYDEQNRTIRQEYPSWNQTNEYFYEKELLSRQQLTIKSETGILNTQEHLYEYSGKKLLRIWQVNRNYTESGTQESKFAYIVNWQSPYSYSYYREEYPGLYLSYQYSTTIKSPNYNFNLTPDGLNSSKNLSKLDLQRRSILSFYNPLEGMLQLEQATSYNRYFLENIEVNEENLPTSYDQISESTINGVITRTKTSFSYTYISLEDR
jgi:hypothetical protein